MYTLTHQTKYLHVENNFFPHKQYLLGFIFSRNGKRAHTDQSILQNLLLGLKRTVSQTFKIAQTQDEN